MEYERTYPDTGKINVDIKTCAIKPMDSCPLVNSSIGEMTQKQTVYYRGLCTNRFKIVVNNNKVTTSELMLYICFLIKSILGYKFHKLVWQSPRRYYITIADWQQQSHPLNPWSQNTWNRLDRKIKFGLTDLARNKRKLIPRKIKVYYSIMYVVLCTCFISSTCRPIYLFHKKWQKILHSYWVLVATVFGVQLATVATTGTI